MKRLGDFLKSKSPLKKDEVDSMERVEAEDPKTFCRDLHFQNSP